MNEIKQTSLEKAAENYIAPIENDEGLDYINFNGRDIKDAFIAGWHDCKEQMMKDAVEGFIFQSEDYYPKELVAQYNGKLKHGDKVKIIIVKED